jgi:hypothetical protein
MNRRIPPPGEQQKKQFREEAERELSDTLEDPLPLGAAIAAFVAGRGLQLGSIERPAWNRLRVIYGKDTQFFVIDAAVSDDRSAYQNVDALDDALYNEAVRQITQHVGSSGGVGSLG